MHPGMKLGPFVIEKELGSGAMGTVYRAQYKEKKQRVAIKVMAPGTGSSEVAQARFQRESEILKQLRHPNIVRLLATGRYKTSPFYAMEYIEGESLDRILARRGRLSWEEVIALGRQLCAALKHAHDQGIVHRDLKPSNLMILPDGTVKLTDFGIAKDLDLTGLTATNCTVGTASYMSPEQCRGERDISSRADLYSMGVMFYELLTGRKPFQAESVMEMFLAHAKKTPERPSRYVDNIPVWMDNLIMQLLAKKPEERPYSAEKVAELLGQIQEKMEAQQSAGVEWARSRAIDRPKNAAELDEADREAARALLGKKKRKKKRTPIYQRGWFVTAAVGAVLAGVAGLMYYVFFVPPSLEALHRQAEEMMKWNDVASWKEAQEGPLALFCTHYKDADGKLADDMRRWLNDANRGLTESWMHNRRSQNLPADDKGEAQARAALDAEDAGNLPRALSTWEVLARQKDDADDDKRGWGLVADKYAVQLRQLDRQMAALYQKTAGSAGKTLKGESPEEELAIQALRAEHAQERGKARDAWEELKRSTDGRAEQRSWYLMAAYKLRGLSEKTNGDKE